MFKYILLKKYPIHDIITDHNKALSCIRLPEPSVNFVAEQSSTTKSYLLTRQKDKGRKKPAIQRFSHFFRFWCCNILNVTTFQFSKSKNNNRYLALNLVQPRNKFELKHLQHKLTLCKWLLLLMRKGYMTQLP